MSENKLILRHCCVCDIVELNKGHYIGMHKLKELIKTEEIHNIVSSSYLSKKCFNQIHKKEKYKSIGGYDKLPETCKETL